MTARLESPDTKADVDLRTALNDQSSSGFTMVAGAGSGKTTSLVKALHYITSTHGDRLLARSQQVACITYTEIAAREIHQEIGNSPLAAVSTIHSFLWSIAKPFQRDIGAWVASDIERRLGALQAKQAGYTPRTHQATKEKDSAKIERRQAELKTVKTVSHWRYGLGSSYSHGVLGHTDVLNMIPELIMERELLAQIVALRFPFILVDESQDTFPNVVEALKHVSALAERNMCLGFFGDPMQQIYPQGIGEVVKEPGWASIKKPENFRSSRTVLACINAVRSEGDELQQVTGLGANQSEGEAFCFVLPSDDQRSSNLERVRSWLDDHSISGTWTAGAHEGGSKVLMIEHRMAARRLGFGGLYAAFHDNKATNLSQSFDDGSAWPLAPFRDLVLPLCEADAVNSPTVLDTLRRETPLIAEGTESLRLRAALVECRSAVVGLRELQISEGATLGGLLRFAAKHNLIELDHRWVTYHERREQDQEIDLDPETVAVLAAMSNCRFSELAGYYKYIKHESPYSTQHGTKGSEFDRVMVVLDDSEGRSNLYSYDKLHGLKELSATDIRNRGSKEKTPPSNAPAGCCMCASHGRGSRWPSFSLRLMFSLRSMPCASRRSADT